MGSRNLKGIAGSRYRQIRVQITHETTGMLSYSILAKGLNDDWRQQHVIVRDSLAWPHPIESVDAAITAALEVLKEQLLPGID